ncbi:MAG: isoaspartyl peptidase/L-asparaginase [Candidatus Eremiobacteraeota bacterium]|nr:isoaspartyl peptidase/L-asparaginase [Candidatus Eremiobacteraeota bacterium]
MKPAIIVHGGAWDIPDKIWQAHKEGCTKALEKGMEMLETGASAIDAVEECIKIMEMNPVFDAGRGSFLNIDGKIEMDAGIMDGKDLSFGAIGGIDGIYHPVSLARKVMEETEHVFLAGNGAHKFARKMGFQKIPYEKLLVGRELDRWLRIKDDPDFRTRTVFEEDKKGRIDKDGIRVDTVGAVAIDINGDISSATSTGGIPKKMSGRIGDAPIVGCGFYADNLAGGASATGWGEQIMKICMCKTAVDFLSEGLDPMEAARRAVEVLETRVDGSGGIILIDSKGRIGHAYNTPRMAFEFSYAV